MAASDGGADGCDIGRLLGWRGARSTISRPGERARTPIERELHFTAPRWARGAHGQTLAGYLLRRAGGVAWRREAIATPDCDELDLDWLEVRDGAARGDGAAVRPLVVILHGLEGSTRSGYMATLARALDRVGCGAVGMNFRGCGGRPNRAPRAYHAGETGDLVHVLDLLRSREPARELGVAGFSLGGNVVLRWLGEAGAAARERVACAAAVSVPFDLAAGSDWSAVGPGRLYAARLMGLMRGKARAKAALLDGRVDIARAARARTFREFDDAFTAPLHGFRDAADYYARSSSGPWLPAIAVPTCIVHADDDPFLPAAAIPRAAFAANPSIDAHCHPHGGHVGFVAGTPWSPRFLAEETVAAFFGDHLRPR